MYRQTAGISCQEVRNVQTDTMSKLGVRRYKIGQWA